MSHLFFRVYAGNMFCGFLSVYPSGTQVFTARNGITIDSYKPIDRVENYKHLKLVRVK